MSCVDYSIFIFYFTFFFFHVLYWFVLFLHFIFIFVSFLWLFFWFEKLYNTEEGKQRKKRYVKRNYFVLCLKWKHFNNHCINKKIIIITRERSRDFLNMIGDLNLDLCLQSLETLDSLALSGVTYLAFSLSDVSGRENWMTQFLY